MTRLLAASLVAAFLVVPSARAQQTAPPRPVSPAAPTQEAKTDVLLTGCLVQGSGPTVFVFQNAKTDPQIAEPGATYLILPGTEDLNLRAHVNHTVQISGQSDGKRPARGTPPDEKDLPTLTAKSLTMVSSTCTGH
jgi:hypothetical protein